MGIGLVGYAMSCCWWRQLTISGLAAAIFGGVIGHCKTEVSDALCYHFPVLHIFLDPATDRFNQPVGAEQLQLFVPLG